MIHSGRGNGRRRLLAAVFILLTAAASLYGRGAKEDSILSHTDELIANKEYDEAIRVLSDYMQTNPDRFGEAQKRLQKIVRIRERYNEVANQLLDTLETDSENSEKILQLSNLMLTIESSSNPSVRRFLDQVRLVAEFNTNRKQLERVLATARMQLEQNNFSGALATYASGLDIYQSAYFSSGYGQEAEDVATRGLQGINKYIQDFNTHAGPFSRAIQSLAAVVNKPELPPPDELWSIYAVLSPLLEELHLMRTGFFEIRESFETQLAILQEEFDVVGDRSFLSFAGWLISGPRDHQEGMIGTLERFWYHWVTQADDTLADLIDRSYSSGSSAMLSRDYSEGVAIFDGTTQYVAVMLDLIRAWNTFFGFTGNQGYGIYGKIVIGEKAGDYLKFKVMNDALVHLREAGTIGDRGMTLENRGFPALPSWQQGRMNTQAAISEEQNIRLSYQTMIDELRTFETQIETESGILRAYEENDSLANIPGGIGTPQDFFNDARNLVKTLVSHFQKQEYNSVVRRYTIANGDLEMRVKERETEFREGNSLIQGVSREMEGLGVYTARYPSEGQVILNQMNQSLGADISTARALTAQYSAEDRTVLAAAEINTLYVSAQALLTRLLDLQRQAPGIIASTRTQIERANALRLEGDRLFQAVQTALNRNDFDAARNSLTRAGEQYDASLAIQESASLRTFRDTNLIRLGAEIVRIENEIVVRDVREYVTNARARYYDGNMEQAEELLVRAQNRWRVTNVTEQPEVEYWLRLVRGALSLQSGRTIAPTAPLYAEMSQLLSDASRSYNEGVRLISSGRRQEGLVRFNEAMEKTREVRLIFPMNRDARMLGLRIEQQMDTSAFNASFRQRLDEAVAGTRSRNAESFADLQDLAEINPRYPGIQTLVSQAEIDMGLRPPPPNPADLARSTELSRNAQVFINSRDATRYAVAQTQLEEAIRLNPNNTQAQMLMDQLQILMTGTGRIVMDSYTQERYNAALQAYLQGNYLSANAIVLQLLQNPDNQRSTQILDLKRRIDALL